MKYHWTRFWLAKNKTAYLSSDGYLDDPQKEMGQYFNKALTEIEKIKDINCMIFIGEAGSGKTTELHKKWLCTDKDNMKTIALWFDLGEYSDERRLCTEIFDNEYLQNWIKSNDSMHIFLDSFDECFLRFETLPRLLLNKLKSLPIERLYLRIACRSNIWPTFFEEDLKDLWPKNSEIFVLAPLRKHDIKEAAEKRGFISSQFLEEIRRLGVEALARNPTTLELLFKLYDEKKDSLEKSEEMYYQCCLKLCMELNPKRSGLRINGNLVAEERLAIVARIAAISIFGDTKEMVKQGSLTIDSALYTHFEDVCGGQETTNIDKVIVGRNEVKETLELTGLFLIKKNNTMALLDDNFTHFLAALYLKRRGLSITELTNLVICQNKAELNVTKVIPQFEKVVEWLVSMIPELRVEILKINPIIVLKSDLSQINQTDREKIVSCVLAHYKISGVPSSFRSDAFQHYYKLRHLNLAKQLLSYLTNQHELEKVKTEAILIACECGVSEVQQDILAIAVNANFSIHIRGLAIRTLSIIANNDVKLKLRELLTRDEKIDTEDELKGYILKCLWPNLISAKELFAQLTPRKKQNFVGSYHMFLRYDMIQHIKKEDVNYILKWLAINEDEVIADNIEYRTIKMSMDYLLIDDQIFNCFIDLLITRIKKYEHIVSNSIEKEFSNLLDNSQELRYRILKAVLDREENDWVDLAYSKPAIIKENDIFWLLTCIQKESDLEKQKYLSRLVSWVVDSQKAETIATIYEVLKNKSYLQENFLWIFGVIDLSSPEALSMKTRFNNHQKWERQAQDKAKNPEVLEDDFTQDKLDLIIDKFHNGDLLVWKEIDSILNGFRSEDNFGADITASYRWQKIDNKIKDEIIKIALAYVELWDYNSDKWRNTDEFNIKVFSDYRALRLVLESDSTMLKELPQEVWKKWAPFTLWYPAFGDLNKNSEHKRKIVKQFYDKVPDIIIEELMAIIDYQNTKGNIFILEDMKYCWDEKLQQAILCKIEKDESLCETGLLTLLDALLQRKSQNAFDYSQNLLTLSESNPKKIIAANALLQHGGLDQWQVIWQIINKDKIFAERIFLEIATHAPYQKYEFINYLTPNDYADIYILMCELFPYENDYKYEDDNVVGPSEQAEHFRDGLLNRLKSWGTWASCLAIRKVKETMKYEWLDYIEYEAIQQALTKTRKTYQIVDVLSWGLNNSPNKRGKPVKGKMKQGTIKERRASEIENNVIVKPEETNSFKILHLSDLHICESTDPVELLQPLITDLRGNKDGFCYETVDCIVISGDITRKGKKEEFIKAQEFVELLMKAVNVDGNRCVIVPGNHDMDWGVEVYSYKKRIDPALPNDRFVREGSGYLVRDDNKYFERFQNFSEFYKSITSRDYPTSHQDEGVIYSFEDATLQILGFNSCWEIDEKNSKRISVNSSAVARCLLEAHELDKKNESENKIPIRLRIAVVHHPVNGQEMIKNVQILERLASAEVRLLLHGHVHVERDEVVNQHKQEKRIVIAGTGTLGAKSSERPSSAPYLYSVLEIYPDLRVKVSVRGKDTEDGMWEGRCRWKGTTSSDNTYSYMEKLD